MKAGTDSDTESVHFLTFLCIISTLTALVLALTAIFNVKYLINLSDKSKARLTIIAEVFGTLVLLLTSWKLCNLLVGTPYNIF